MSFVYKITNDINGKIYIGKTELQNPLERWNEHLRDYKRDRFEKRPLYDAMNKYGEEHFYFEVIEETTDPEEREKYWIDKLRTYIGFEDCNGYNATLGGDGKSYLNLDAEQIIKYHIEEAVFKISDTAKYFNVDRQTIEKILVKHGITWVDRKDWRVAEGLFRNGCVVQLDKDCKMVIDRFKNSNEAAECLGIKEGAIRRACCYSKNHLSHGYTWYYQKDLNKLNIEIIDVI